MCEERNESDLTQPQRDALKWLEDHNGDGLFDRNGVLLAAGESAPHLRSTWNRLRDLGMVEFYNPTGKGRGRCRLTIAGRRIAQAHPSVDLPFAAGDVIQFPGERRIIWPKAGGFDGGNAA